MWKQIRCDREQHLGGAPGGLLLLGQAQSADLSAYAGKVQCVYMDPPFLTGDAFEMRMRVGADGWETGKRVLTLPAYADRFASRGEYLAMLRGALEQARALLCESGSLFLHVDSRVGAYARILCDKVFGETNFVNEVIWAYQSGGRAKKHFSRKHDVILFYAKHLRAHYFDIARVSVPRAENRSNHMRRSVDENGRPCRTIRSGGKVYTYYDDEPVYPSDVWSDVSHLQQKDPQRTGYDTQKPQALLNRIILSTTRPGDIVADLFCGSGTTGVAAAAAGRGYLLCDQSRQALSVSRKRLLDTRLCVQAQTDFVDAALTAAIEPALGYYEVRLQSYALPERALGALRQAGGVAPLGPLDALDQVSAGFVSGGVFHAHVNAARRKQSPELPEVIELPLLRGQAALLTVDILGRRALFVRA